MSARIKWFDRQFNFDFLADTFPELIERLRGTPARLEVRLNSLPTDILVQPDGEKWSIQEHVGHLMDIDESLIMGRLDDYEDEEAALRPADLSNRQTHDAHHNSRDIVDVLAGFRTQRAAVIERLERADPSFFARTARHPRLDMPMRVCDMLFFHGEHDDYHLARITELVRKFGGQSA